MCRVFEFRFFNFSDKLSKNADFSCKPDFRIRLAVVEISKIKDWSYAEKSN